MSLSGHVSSNNGGRSEIKNLIIELITEIEREHGLDKFPERCTEIDENLDLESKKSPKKGLVFQNLLEDRMKRVELVLASFQRQKIQSREESRKREMLLFKMTTELQERIDIHDAKLIDQKRCHLSFPVFRYRPTL